MSSEMPALLTVRDAAHRLNVTPRTLKYYEERGLVTPARSDGRYRLYSEDDLDRFGRILRLRSLGFSLSGITEMLKRPLEPAEGGRRRYSNESLREIRDGLSQQVAALDARIDAVRRELKEAQALKTELVRDLDYVERRLAGENADALLDERRALGAKRRTPTPARRSAEAARGTARKRAADEGL
ncbi:MerR family transcriptional regulator [Paraburkholderia kururiensis]|uniref:MerR family transcriptional regulator n=1 Tax=Paraburkholderia kururiensis TaxID=984307 RepID=A0ABZ0WSG9_9BURK|nr:MerR family transcriptional regulator [Paraburkholderia kururiensis]WQD80208.1 MerR family transcriptional regulator [Paraburkholderia kururiensis]